MEFALQPSVYQTGPRDGLRSMLEDIWIRELTPGQGTIHVVSGFGNFNGGARFYKAFKEHTERGGRIAVTLGGSTSQRLSSMQLVEALLECGASVRVINRKAILHAKCYGVESAAGISQSLVISSGNFTGPGMSRNIEASMRLGANELEAARFSWGNLTAAMGAQGFLIYTPVLANRADPAWQLLYDEGTGQAVEEEAEIASTMILVLGRADTARIQADRGTAAGAGTPYFWLSKDCFDFFPPLTIRNSRGIKGTLRANVMVNFVDVGVESEVSVTFEAENNLDFRFRVSPLQFTRKAAQGDIACITRTGQSTYVLKIIRQSEPEYARVAPFAVTLIGHREKRYGFISNEQFAALMA